MHFETTRTHQGIIDHVLSVGHTNEQDIVQLVYTIELRKELIHHAVANACASTSAAASLLADCIQFIEDDDVQARFVTLFLVLFLCICEELANILF